MTPTEYEWEIHVAEEFRASVVGMWQRGEPIPVITWDAEYNVPLHGGEPIMFGQTEWQFYCSQLGILGMTYDETFKETIAVVDKHLKFLYMFAPDPC